MLCWPLCLGRASCLRQPVEEVVLPFLEDGKEGRQTVQTREGSGQDSTPENVPPVTFL